MMNKFEKTLAFIRKEIRPESPFYGQIYLVGGCVRDELLGERYTDLDLLINMPNGQREFVEYMCATYPETCQGPFYYQRYGTTAMDVTIDGTLTLVECVEPHIEEYAEDGVTLLQTSFCSLEEDAKRRDYTCNALYKNLHTNEISDPTRLGINDLKNKLLRTPLSPDRIFKQDPVRMLRGIRFKHQKGFHLDNAAWQAIIDNHDEMRLSAPKRLRDELNKIIKTNSFGEAINDLHECGLLPYIIPGLENYIDNSHLPYLEDGLSTWDQTRLALRILCKEHPYTLPVFKLATLFLHIAEVHGIGQVREILLAGQIGKDKSASVCTIIEKYFRFKSFFHKNQYMAKPRALPHFIVGLDTMLDGFRRMTRALNNGVLQEFQLPYQLFFTDRKGKTTYNSRASFTYNNSDGVMTGKASLEPLKASQEPDQTSNGVTAATSQRHKRNVKRREQRKRAAARRREEQQSNPQD